MNTSLTLLTAAGATALVLALPTVAPRPAPSPEVAPAAVSIPAAPAGPAAPGATRERVGASTSGSSGTTATDQTDALSRGVVLIASTTPGGGGAGTGMVLTASGQVLTNYHVVQGSTALEVTVPDTGATYAASVVGHDATRDVALLQLADAADLATITPDEDALAIGDALTAVGNASGGGRLVAASGRVTDLEQEVTVSGEYGQETLRGVIETNAGAVPGDSGGPMFDAQGEVLGMTTAGGEGTVAAPGARGARGRGGVVTTVSYAVPIEDALAVVEQIRSGRDAGSVQVGPKAYLGITVGGSQGLVVASVLDGGPAADAGLTAGSVITAIDGTAVTTHDELAGALRGLDPGARVDVAWTDARGVRHTAPVTLVESPVN